ncbi:hypothetical protein [Anaerotignum sp.]|uniref:hypothetical protein n=1 Tax=Anaerotignum sp. TaxID=2039241 RepID=UPI0028A853C4|nr:hypothetical protein [Anaerotignum sp.]
MRILFKILLFPIIVILSVCSLVCRFFTIISGTILNTFSILMALFTLLCLALGIAEWDNMARNVLIFCLLFSEFGLFALAHLLLNGVDNATRKLRQI